MVLKELIFNSFYIWEGLVVLKELIFNSFNFWWCGCLERTDFNRQTLLWKGVVVLITLIFDSL